MAVDINQKYGNSIKASPLTCINNAKGNIYVSLEDNNPHEEENVSDTSLKKTRNSGFWAVAPAKYLFLCLEKIEKIVFTFHCFAFQG